MEVSKKRSNFALLLRGNPEANGDSLAQLVEHNTFNVGVVGSSPTRITNKISQIANSQQFGLLLFPKIVNILSTKLRCQQWIRDQRIF